MHPSFPVDVTRLCLSLRLRNQVLQNSGGYVCEVAWMTLAVLTLICHVCRQLCASSYALLVFFSVGSKAPGQAG